MDVFEWRFSAIVPWLCHILEEYLRVWGFETGLLKVWDVEDLNLKRRVCVKWLLFTLCSKLQYAYKIYITNYFSNNIYKCWTFKAEITPEEIFYSALGFTKIGIQYNT